MLVVKWNLNEGDNGLILGASSGIGSASIQIANFFNATVYTTVSSKNKYNFAEFLGADKVYYHNKYFYYIYSLTLCL